jgi:hypothetical protein
MVTRFSETATMSWRSVANDAIKRAIANGKADGLEGSELEKYVRRKGYPFGERAMHPYKIWCSEMQRIFKKGKHKPIEADNVRVNPETGQLELF